MEERRLSEEMENAPEVDLPSCDGCRKRKLKCSKEATACANCVRLNVRCTYEYQRKKPGLKTGAVEGLTRRVEALEALLGGRPESTNNATLSTYAEARPTDPAESVAPVLLSLLVDELQRLNSNLTSSFAPPGRPSTPKSFSETFPAGEHPDPGPDTSFSLAQAGRKRLRTDHGRRRRLSSPQSPDDYAERRKEAHPLHDRSFVQELLRMQEKAKDSRKLVVLDGMGDLTLESLQALAIVAFVDIADGKNSYGWSLVASLTRNVQRLHLNVEESTQGSDHVLLPTTGPAMNMSENWAESEERRRVFWGIFLLDRLGSISTGSKPTLTAEEVSRRLPVDGGLWRKCQPALTPFFDIWDSNAANIANTIAFLPSQYEVTGQESSNHFTNENELSAEKSSSYARPAKIGAFSYCIEAVESLSRITSFFLQQKINYLDRSEVSSWLTRFKELDLRLVHWKKFLPQRWKNPDDTHNPVTAAAMDPNMTLAHVAHNTSLIFLHQRVAYPSEEIKHLKLPSACSAETCFLSAVQTANISSKYLQQGIVTNAMAPLFSLCIFASAKILLVHAKFCNEALPIEFRTLVEMLERISLTWQGNFPRADQSTENLPRSLASALRRFHEQFQGEDQGREIALFQRKPLFTPLLSASVLGREDNDVQIDPIGYAANASSHPAPLDVVQKSYNPHAAQAQPVMGNVTFNLSAREQQDTARRDGDRTSLKLANQAERPAELCYQSVQQCRLQVGQ
ncbi:fungal specific transcription factor [Colletotrichum musicola]|uniref:Fungal specific transcription factor n=1 Tax=Colletotrichum musicola TaxID=2175873 RepID=A0A8H6MNR7_9PEZI|nr:fungal specific transcription factor [Colletotrichum musicola]